MTRNGRDPDLNILMTAIQDDRRKIYIIADAAGIARGTMYNWFAGKTRHPQHFTMSAVAHALGLQWKLVRGNSR